VTSSKIVRVLIFAVAERVVHDVERPALVNMSDGDGRSTSTDWNSSPHSLAEGQAGLMIDPKHRSTLLCRRQEFPEVTIFNGSMFAPGRRRSV